MIRREAGDSQSASWTLISQIDHAHLAGRLAEFWGAGGMAAIEPRRELLWAIDHHDDGWQAWDQRPGIDPGSGRPRSFTEMEMNDSVRIWTGSIEAAKMAGPLESFLVASHFLALARRAASRSSDTRSHAGAEFIASCETLLPRFLEAWQDEDRVAHTREIAEQALAQLRFFDLLSLWFCCAPAAQAEVIETPGGPGLTLRPTDPMHVRLSPWPLSVNCLNLEIQAVQVPRANYANAAELAAAPSQPVRLRWLIEPKVAEPGQNVDEAT